MTTRSSTGHRDTGHWQPGVGISKSSAFSASKRAAQNEANDDGSVLLDEYGRDVTPKRLIADVPVSLQQQVSKFFARGTAAIHERNIDLDQDSRPDISDDVAALSVSGVSIPSADASEDESEEEISTDHPQASAIQSKPEDHTHDADEDRRAVRKLLSGYHPSTLVALSLEETDTDILLHIPAARVMADTPAADITMKRNNRYAEFASHMEQSGDGYSQKAAQTLHGIGAAGASVASKSVQANPPVMKSAAVQATNWDIADSDLVMRELEEAKASERMEMLHDNEGNEHTESKTQIILDGSIDVNTASAALKRQVQEVLAAGDAAPGFQLDTEGNVRIGPPITEQQAEIPFNHKQAKSRQRMRSTMNNNLSISVSQSVVQRRPLDASSSQMTAHVGFTETNSLSQSGRSEDSSSIMDSARKQDDDTLSSEIEDDAKAAAVAYKSIWHAKEAAKVLSSRQLILGLSTVERAIQQNLYHHAHRLYRSRAGAEAVEGLLAGMRKTIAAAVGVDTREGDITLDGLVAQTEQKQLAVLQEPRGGEGQFQSSHSQHSEEDGLYTEKPIYDSQEDGEDEGTDTESFGIDQQAAELQQTMDRHSENEESDSESEHSEEGPVAKSTVLENNLADHEGADGELAHKLELLADKASDRGNRNVSALLHGLRSLALGPKADAGVLLLFSYRCKELEGMTVHSMAWNRVNSDLLAAGYGPAKYTPSSHSSGYLALWSIKNPEFPQALVKVEAGVTALHFSKLHPNMLAAGLYDGRVAIWDVRRLLTGESVGDPEAISEPLTAGAHTDAVWQVQWVAITTTRPQDESEDNRDGPNSQAIEDENSSVATRNSIAPIETEQLFSIGTDGKVNQWNTKKGLLCKTMMTLRQPRSDESTGSNQANILAATTNPAIVDALQSKRYGAIKLPESAPDHSANISGLRATKTSSSSPVSSKRTQKRNSITKKNDESNEKSIEPTSVHDTTITRVASALCFDFPMADASSYLAGTDDGFLHHCSTSYSEQTLRSIKLHGGPINRIRISPFYQSAILTAGSDWNIKLFDITDQETETEKPAQSSETNKMINGSSPDASTQQNTSSAVTSFNIASAADSINDVIWHPQVSTWFSSVSGDGHVCIWDVASPLPLVDFIATKSKSGQDQDQGIIGLIKSAGEEERAGENDSQMDSMSDLGADDIVEKTQGNRTKARKRAMSTSTGSDVSHSSDQDHDDEDVRIPKRLTTVLFANDAPVLVTGDDSGHIDVYRLMGPLSQGTQVSLTRNEMTEELYYAIHPDREREDEGEDQ